MTIKASIFVSYYNGLRYLETFLENYRTQTIFDNLEMIFVGCCLTDKERGILKLFETAHLDQLKVIELDTLESQSHCWNLAIKAASSDLVCEWNVDDVRTDDSIERQVNLFEKDPELGLVTGNFAISREFPVRKGEYVEHRWRSKEDWQKGMLLGPFFMFRKSLCDTIGWFDEQLKSGADYDMSVRLVANAKIGFTNYLLGYFTDEGRGLSTGGNQLQPIERTVVELRNEFPVLDMRFVQEAMKYRLNERLQFGEWVKI